MLERLHAHREWGNKVVIDWYLALPQPEEYCLKMISHILMGEDIWLCRLRDAQSEFAQMMLRWECFPLERLKPLSEANNAGWREALKSDFSKVVRYHRFGGEASESVIADIATHVCTHAVYHRGQIAGQAARVGLKPVPTDFIVFSRLGN